MPSTLAAFFDRYRRAFAEADLDALVAMFNVPCLVLSDRGVSAPPDREALRERLRGQIARHGELGVSSAELVLLDHRRLDANHLQAEVRWILHGADAKPLSTFALLYLLVRSESGWRIAVVAPLESIG